MSIQITPSDLGNLEQALRDLATIRADLGVDVTSIQYDGEEFALDWDQDEPGYLLVVTG